jgi:hypothetical protein
MRASLPKRKPRDGWGGGFGGTVFTMQLMIMLMGLVTPTIAVECPAHVEDAEAGDAQQQYLLGTCYHYGYGSFLQDAVEAAEWYHLAAAQGEAKAQSTLGTMYRNGEGVTRDYATAYAW